MWDETGDLDEAGDRSRRVDQDETTVLVIQLMVHLEDHAKSARVDERHAGEIDSQVARTRRRSQRVADRCCRVGIDLATENDGVRAALDSEWGILGGHRRDATET